MRKPDLFLISHKLIPWFIMVMISISYSLMYLYFLLIKNDLLRLLEIMPHFKRLIRANLKEAVKKINFTASFFRYSKLTLRRNGRLHAE